MRKLLKKHGRAARVLITDKLRSYAAGNRDLGINVEHRQHKGLNTSAENSHQATRVREKVVRRFKSARHLHDSRRSTIRWRTCSCTAATT